MEYTLADAAKTAKVNRSTLFRAIKSGRLSASRLEDGSYRVDASELARVYDLQHAVHRLDGALQHGAQGENAPATVEGAGVELAVLRVRVQMLEVERERWDQERETIRETVDDLRKRLDQEQEERRNLQRQLAPPTQSAQEPLAVVEELRRRLAESEAHIRALVTSASPVPQATQERPDEAPAPVELTGSLRSFLARVLGRA